MKKGLLLFAVAAFAFACSQPAAETTEESTEETMHEETAAAEEEMTDSVHFGEMIDAEGALFIDEFSAKMAEQDSMEVKISAIAEEVCQKKGCWMKVKLADGEMMRIRFKDYGFFVPKDLAGKEVVFSGKAFRETVSVEDLKHYAEDGGASEEEIAAITEPEDKISFMADGVMIK